MLSLKAFLNDRLAAVAEEIFAAVEKTIDEYKEELCRVKDLEIGRLRMQLRLLKSDGCNGAQLQEHPHPQHAPPPIPQKQDEAASADMEANESQNIEEEGSSSLELPNEPAQVKKEPERNHREFWLGQCSEPLEDLESDIKDFMSSASGVRAALHDSVLPFHLYHGGIGDEGREKPYSCSVCDKRFGNCSHLAAHIRTHTGERPYRCDICRKSFVTTSALNRHQTIHTEGKHYVCIYCSKAFKWMESLGRHVRIAHKRPNVPQVTS
ncbi:zinc finger and SCAN domain-containing protein 12-like [Corythoichthys intestinalis]|uniref:zinc finger and SCAN domain-containing protein 12-like n=1 Tax=Corythoichthys intestinalis TaxID=161448 RepID=UPI0025A5108B|nr:zinc finger and SCAN domain-containing protein 12-like [Corythoichthys intestinalis]